MRGSEVLQNEDVSYLEKVLFKKGELQVMPSSFYESIPHNHLRIFCVKNGIYQLPTLELVGWLLMMIDGRKAIEIASGNGALANMLNITATDSFIQDDIAVKRLYDGMKQTTVPYGINVKKYEAKQAIKKFKPEVVIGCWATQKFQPGDNQASVYGINEEYIVKRVQTYIHIGNLDSHNEKRILRYPHKTWKFSWLYSRGADPERNVVYVWNKV